MPQDFLIYIFPLFFPQTMLQYKEKQNYPNNEHLINVAGMVVGKHTKPSQLSDWGVVASITSRCSGKRARAPPPVEERRPNARERRKLSPGVLTICRKEPVGMKALINGKGFSKISKPTERDGAYHLRFGFCYCFPLMRDSNWKIVQMVRKFQTIRFEPKKEDYLWR